MLCKVYKFLFCSLYFDERNGNYEIIRQPSCSYVIYILTDNSKTKPLPTKNGYTIINS